MPEAHRACIVVGLNIIINLSIFIELCTTRFLSRALGLENDHQPHANMLPLTNGQSVIEVQAICVQKGKDIVFRRV